VLHLAQWDHAGVEREIKGLLALNPSWGEVYEALGNFAVTQRLYRQSVGYFRKAVELNPRLWSAYSTLGINLLRLGEEAAAHQALETSYQNDPFNVWTVNTLRLIDSFENFKEVNHGRFRIKLHKKEADVLEQYASGLLEEVTRTLGDRYSYRPSGSIYLEMYPDHEDFAVRTLGMPGLGALGVCFGTGMVMDSPSARPKGTFNWGSTLWHEFAHVITLGVTDHRIPRWFSEGISVMEEHRARPGWGDALTVDIVKLIREKKVLPIGELNAAFSRPRFPGQVPFAYFQAGQVCEFIEKEFGFPKILTMLSLYKSGESLDQVLQQALGLTSDAFDKQFSAYLDQKYGPTVRAVDVKILEQQELLKNQSALRSWLEANPNDFFGTLHLAKLLVEQGKKQEAIPLLEKAKALYPEYDGPDNPYRQLADIHKEAGRLEQAVGELQDLRSHSANNFESMKRLGLWLKEAGRPDESISALTDALYIYPFDLETHQVLAELASQKNHHETALREYRVLLSLDQADKAGAHFNIAKTLAQLGRPQEARREVLAALEIAPEFEAAQELLLQLSKD
jgi:tetratricopeptide (TPR) repeat protein